MMMMKWRLRGAVKLLRRSAATAPQQPTTGTSSWSTTGTSPFSFTTSSLSNMAAFDRFGLGRGRWGVGGGRWWWGSIRFSYDNGDDNFIIKYGKYINNRYIY